MGFNEQWKKLNEQWEKLNEGYADISREVTEKGFSTVGNLIFFPLFVFGFVYFKNYGSNDFDIKTPFEIVFNWSLVIYSALISVIAIVLYNFSKNKIFRGLLTRALETTISLLFICLAGYTMRVVELPFLGVPNKYSFVIFGEFLVFSYLWVIIKFLVDDDIENKGKALKALQWVLGLLLSIFILNQALVS